MRTGRGSDRLRPREQFKGESSSLKKQKKKAKAAERPARAPEQDDELTQEVDGAQHTHIRPGASI